VSFPIKMVIFHSYVRLTEATALKTPWLTIDDHRWVLNTLNQLTLWYIDFRKQKNMVSGFFPDDYYNYNWISPTRWITRWMLNSINVASPVPCPRRCLRWANWKWYPLVIKHDNWKSPLEVSSWEKQLYYTDTIQIHGGFSSKPCLISGSLGQFQWTIAWPQS
jgi:hypothetical protein